MLQFVEKILIAVGLSTSFWIRIWMICIETDTDPQDWFKERNSFRVDYTCGSDSSHLIQECSVYAK